MKRDGYHPRATPGRPLRLRSPRLRGLAVGLLVLVAVGWLGAETWYPGHLERVTGRTDLGMVSCLRCHGSATAPSWRPVPDTTRYVSPTGLAVSPDGTSLFVVASGSGRLLQVDTGSGRVLRSVAVGDNPHAVAISTDGTRLAVSLRDDDRVVILDAARLTVLSTLATGADPVGLTFSEDGTRLWVADGASDDVSLLGLDDAPAIRRLVAGNEPYAVTRAARGDVVAVANRLARPTRPGEIPVSELTLIDTAEGRIADRRALVSAHLSEGVALSADGSFALATAIRVRNLLPITQVARGAVMNAEVVYAETGRDGRTVQLPLDELNAYYADPAGIVMTPDDRLAFVAHAGANAVTAIDVAAVRALVRRSDPGTLAQLADRLDVAEEYVLARIPTRRNPQNMAVSADGERLYVAERLSDSVAVVDVASLEVVDRFELGHTEELSARRRGEIAFTDASVTFQGQFSCRSCHPDGNTDTLIWDFVIDGVGRNLVETRSLRGIRDTAPFKWNGKNPNLATQCGPRFAMVLTRSDPFDPAQLSDLVTFIESIPRVPRRTPDRLAAARERGHDLFFRTRTTAGEIIPVPNRCPTCHRPPLFTDRLKADVGTGGDFDTPHLFGVGSTAPYLHDGRALTLEEVWTVYSPNNEHGVTSDLTKVQLNDLMLYLRSL